MLTLEEQTLIRAWIRGVPLASLPMALNYDSLALLKQLRLRLLLKARRLGYPQATLWLKRESQDWEQNALQQLACLLNVEDIQADIQQPLTFWLAPQYTDTLAAHKIFSLEDLIGYYQTHGKCWWRAIARLGRSAAKQIESTVQRILPGSLTTTKIVKAPRYTSAIVPLEHLVLPENLTGAQGSNRAVATPFIPLTNDLVAINAWLSLYSHSPHTQRSYQREAERLLLWAIISQHKPLSSLDTTDMVTYRQFLHAPSPENLWLGAPYPKNHPQWKPFTGPLSSRSIKHAETIINTLFTFLVQQRYLQHNPLSALPKGQREHNARLAVERAFTPTQWAAIVQFAQQAINAPHGLAQRKALRMMLILQLAYATGLRLQELSQITLGDIRHYSRQGITQYWLNVLGKGQKLRQVPLPPTTLDSIQQIYYQFTGTALFKQASAYPLIADLRDASKNLTPIAIHKLLKAFFSAAAQQLTATEPQMATHIAKASAHWLRHTHGSNAAEQGISLTMIRDNLGHASIATTSHYLHTDNDARYAAFAALMIPTAE